jgi:23S rRNA-/tRNA-specific pseudouridylate synthase
MFLLKQFLYLIYVKKISLSLKSIFIEGKWRLDKLLSQQLIGISRSEIVKWIKQGDILVDGEKVRSGQSIHEGQRIWIDLE